MRDACAYGSDMAAQRLIIAGGGLAGCLAALALAKARPEVELRVVEEQARFGGDHIWSFFDSDLAPVERTLLTPLEAARWPDHEVSFPRLRRRIDRGYASLTSDRLDRAVREALPATAFRLGTAIRALDAGGVELAGGETIDGSGVIDARGLPGTVGLQLGWQKFLGRLYRLPRPHRLDRPLIMDATVDQADGYRFVYCLPFTADELLIEDTYYSLSAALDRRLLGQRLDDYAASRGWSGGEVLREEHGVLPVVLDGALETLWQGSEVALLGMRGGFFHPTTGYSLPDAVHNATLLARQSALDSASLHHFFAGEAVSLWRDRGFYRLLNRMLFFAADPPERYRVLEHFYRLDPDIVARFYAARSSLVDKLRILSGRPPVRLGRAVAAIFGKGAARTA